jgi:predicted transcriptional regulator
MSWKQEFVALAEPVDGRVAPSFEPHHVAVAFILIGREQPLGRYELCKRMSIGEGTVRTLLKRLTESNLITAVSRQGQKLTEEGQELYNRITEDIPIGLSLPLINLAVFGHSFVNRVSGKGDAVTDGIRQRDEAVIKGGAGQAGATTLVMKDGVLVIPPDDFKILLLYEDEALLISESLRGEDGDAVVIGTAVSENLAREVSMAAVMTLFEAG